MAQEFEIITASLRTRRVAASAGTAFAPILGIALVHVRVAISADSRDAGIWLDESFAWAQILFPLWVLILGIQLFVRPPEDRLTS